MAVIFSDNKSLKPSIGDEDILVFLLKKYWYSCAVTLYEEFDLLNQHIGKRSFYLLRWPLWIVDGTIVPPDN